MVTRPRIGLALGSGAGRGWAHIGVLRALERAGVEADVVCGTSVGALVGGVYLAGRLDTLEEWARKLNMLRLLRYIDVRVKGGGLIAGDRLMNRLERDLGDILVEDLGKPFAAVATEIPTGHEIWLRRGRLADALRASFALPGVFTPFDYEGHWLVDGALVNPVPVSVCRAFASRLVIAVNLNADLIGKERQGRGELRLPTEAASTEAPARGRARRLAERPVDSLLRRVLGADQEEGPSLFTVMASSLSVIQDRLSRSRLAGDPPDVTIAPRLGHIGLLEFDRAEEAIAEGEAATERSLPFLQEALSILG
jgi:NTE family protein